MRRKKAFNMGGQIARTSLAGVIIAVCLSLAGCNDQMARIEDSQLELQAMVEANSERMALIASNLEQNQQELEIRVENLQNGTQDVVSDMAAVADEQKKIYSTIKTDNHELQNLIGTIQNDTQTLTSTVASVTDEQVKLHQIVEENSRQMAEMVAAIEQNQQQWQNTINSIEENVQRLTVSIDALGQNLLILQEVLQSSVHELAEVRGADGSVDLELSPAFTSPSETNLDNN